MRRLHIKLVATIVLCATPIAAWALWKPIRVLAPELAGVKCYVGRVCTDDPSKVAEALGLRREALSYVEQNAGGFRANPRMIFCTTPQCDRSFGFAGNAAYNFGSSGLVVSARGWHSYDPASFPRTASQAARRLRSLVTGARKPMAVCMRTRL